ncbi:hypothetical protein BDZ89DRAFT_1170237 [Hymenopellis radicata]|nr:hypothetical protein BDZ89DRAFT_1170237 [Hymenopellis radicata]
MGLIPDTPASSSGLLAEPRKTWNSISSVDSAETITPSSYEDMYPRITPRYPEEEDETSSGYEESVYSTNAPWPSPEPTAPDLEPLTWRVLQFKKAQEKGTIFQSELYDVEDDKKPCYRISYELTVDDKLKKPKTKVSIARGSGDCKVVAHVSWFPGSDLDIYIHHVREKTVKDLFDLSDITDVEDQILGERFLHFPARFTLKDRCGMYWRIDKRRLGLYRCAVDAGFSPASLKGKNKCAPPQPIAEFVYNAKHLTHYDGFRKRHLHKGSDFLRLPMSGNEVLDTELILSFLLLEVVRHGAFDLPPIPFAAAGEQPAAAKSKLSKFGIKL